MSRPQPEAVWLNGAFGVGKSSVAERLRDRLTEATVFDPEPFGTLLRDAVPAGWELDDFQEIPTWRDLTRETVSSLVRHTGRTVIVPMTIVEPPSFVEIVDELRTRHRLAHFTLFASAETIVSRLASRSGAEDWGLARVDRCSERLAEDAFAIHVPTDLRPPADIAAEIAGLLS